MREAVRLFDLGNFVPDCFMQRLLVPLCSLLSGRDRSRFSCDGAVIVSGRSRFLVRLTMTTLEVAVRAKDDATAWRTMHVDALPRICEVLKQWPALAFDVWAPHKLKSGETHLFPVKHLWRERNQGCDHVSSDISEPWNVLTSAIIMNEFAPRSARRRPRNLHPRGDLRCCGPCRRQRRA